MTDLTHACPPDGSGLMPCCGRTPLEVPRTDRMTEDPAGVTCGPATFALWLDASDGSIASHDGVRWPDGTATIHHRYHRGLTATHSSPEAACQSAYGKQGRIVWNDAARTTPDIAPASGDAADNEPSELTADEARDLATDLGRELYEAQDALMFAREMCDLADQNGTPVTTARVRQWLQGAPKCGRQAFAPAVAAPATADDGLRERVAAAIRQALGALHLPWTELSITTATAAAAEAVLAIRDRRMEQLTIRAEGVERSVQLLTTDLLSVAQQRDQAEAERDRLRKTVRRLNHRAQQAESNLTAVTRAVAEWKLGEHGTTYVPLRTLTAIARAVGRPVEAGRYELHYQRVERAEAAIDRVRDLRERARTEAPMAQGPTWRGLDEALDGPQPTCTDGEPCPSKHRKAASDRA